MRLKFWRKQTWQDLGSITFTVPAGSYKAQTTIQYEKGQLDKTIVIVPIISIEDNGKKVK